MQPATQVGRRTVSLAVAIIMLIAGAALGAGVAYVGVSRFGSTGGLCSSGRTLTIGALYDLTDGLSNQGNRAKASSQIAIDDINAFLATGGCSLRFAVNVSDYGLGNDLDNQKALTALQAFAASGVQVVVGPLNSGSAQFILSYANSNHIVLISPSSTSPAISINNDYLFRTVPNDLAQGLADARMLWDQGAKAVVIVNRHDTYGDGLADATAKRFTELGGFVQSKIAYDTSTSDFTAIITQLNTDYAAADAAYPGQVAIDAITFEEIRSLLIQTDQQHPNLLSTPFPWFGTDGQAANTLISNNATAGPLVARVKLPSTLYATTNNTKSIELFTKFVAQRPSDLCDSYCLGAYDDVWLAALATLQAGSYDGTAIQKVLSTVASNTYGVTGWLGLEASGDRVPTAYQIWKVVNPTAPTWVLAGTWDKSTDAITWISPP